MGWYWGLYGYVTILTILTSLHPKCSIYKYKFLILCLLAISLINFSGFRGINVDRDSLNYLNWFQTLNNFKITTFLIEKDPGFYILAKFVNYFDLGFSTLILIFSIISILIKFRIISLTHYAPLIGIFFYLYFCKFYFVYDMTAIRGAVGIAFATLSIIMFLKEEKTKGLIFFICALAFHLSIIIFIPIIILISMKYEFQSRFALLIIVASSILSALFTPTLLLSSGLDHFNRIAPYLNNTDQANQANIISSYFLLKIFLILGIALGFWDRLELLDRLTIYMSTLGVSISLIFMKNDTLALRFSELFSIFDIFTFLIPIFFLEKKWQSIYAIFILLCGSVFFISSLKIMQPYFI